jgi:hypothetical protein
VLGLLCGAGALALIRWWWQPFSGGVRPAPVFVSPSPRSEAELQRCARVLGLRPERPALADATNFGERQPRDWLGRPLPHQPRLIVLHETVLDQADTLNLFRTPHPADADQVSYHLVFGPDGDRHRVVPDAKRAYGAGQSAFGDFTLQAKPSSRGSINNVALHASLVTPPDGRGARSGDAHSGYTPAQYTALAAQVLLWQHRYGIPMSRVTTHAAVDRSHSRYDPRSFRWDLFDRAYAAASGRCGFSG